MGQIWVVQQLKLNYTKLKNICIVKLLENKMIKTTTGYILCITFLRKKGVSNKYFEVLQFFL